MSETIAVKIPKIDQCVCRIEFQYSPTIGIDRRPVVVVRWGEFEETAVSNGYCIPLDELLNTRQVLYIKLAARIRKLGSPTP